MQKNEEPNRGAPHGLWNSVIPSPIRAVHSRICNNAKITPPPAVISVQRKAPDLSCAFAARTPNSMVKLLVRRMKVIRETFTMLWNGLGQLGEPLRKKP